MARSPKSRQLAMRAKTRISGLSRSQLQKQLSAYQRLTAASKSKADGKKKSSAQPSSKIASALPELAKKARGMTSMRQFQSAKNTVSHSKTKKTLQTQVGSVKGNGAGGVEKVDSELLKQNMVNLGQALYGVAVNPQVGPDGEIFFASEKKRYADVGYWYQGKTSGRGETQTSFLLEPPFDETVVEVQSSTEYQPIAEALPQSQPTGARVLNIVTDPFPVASDVHASVFIGSVVNIPKGYRSISVTTTGTIQSSIAIATDPNSAVAGEVTSACHYFRTSIEGPGFSPIPLTNYLDLKFGHDPLPLQPVPIEQSITQSWNNLGHNHGEFLVMIGIGGLHHCFGPTSYVTAGLWLDVKSIQVDVS